MFAHCSATKAVEIPSRCKVFLMKLYLAFLRTITFLKHPIIAIALDTLMCLGSGLEISTAPTKCGSFCAVTGEFAHSGV